jgi:hypothetical protein
LGGYISARKKLSPVKFDSEYKQLAGIMLNQLISSLKLINILIFSIGYIFVAEY